MSVPWTVALGMTCGVLGCTAAGAGTIRVPGDYPTLLAGVDAAAAGDTVLVGPGSYTATAVRGVVINGQALALEAAAFLRPGIAVVAEREGSVVDAGPSGRAFVFGETPGIEPTLVSGFEITGSQGFVVSQPSSLEIQECTIRDCAFSALSSSSGSLITLRDCWIERNELARTTAQFGTFYSLNSTLELYDCVIQDNNQRGVYATGGGRLVMERCYVAGHSITRNGAGVLAEQVPDIQIRDSWFVGNSGSSAGAIGAGPGSVGVIEFCVFLRDSASSGSGGAVDIASAVRLSNNTFVGCDAVNFGSAISIQPDLAGVDHNIIANCSAQDGAIVLWTGTPKATSGCNLFWQNAGGDFSTFGYWTASPTDVFVDPQFCGFPVDDFTLHSSSPAAAPNQPVCGQIGAFGTNCGPVSVQNRSWGGIKGSYR